RSAAERALHRHVAAHVSRELAADRQPEPSSLSGSRQRVIHLHERLEDLVEQVVANAASRVLHLDTDGSVVTEATHVDAPRILNFTAFDSRLSMICSTLSRS